MATQVAIVNKYTKSPCKPASHHFDREFSCCAPPKSTVAMPPATLRRCWRIDNRTASVASPASPVALATTPTSLLPTACALCRPKRVGRQKATRDRTGPAMSARFCRPSRVVRRYGVNSNCCAANDLRFVSPKRRQATPGDTRQNAPRDNSRPAHLPFSCSPSLPRGA